MVAAPASPFLRTGAASLYWQPRPLKAVDGGSRWRPCDYEPARVSPTAHNGSATRRSGQRALPLPYRVTSRVTPLDSRPA